MQQQKFHCVGGIWNSMMDDPRPALYLSIIQMLLASLLVILWFGRHPPSQGIFWPIYCVLVLFVILSCISFVRWLQLYFSQKTNPFSRTGFSSLNNTSSVPTDPHHEWTANRRNTILTASIATLIMPLIFYFIWKPDLVANVMVVQRAEVPSVYYPSIAVLQNVDWTSQADLTLDSRPKCFVGWMKDGLPACDAVQPIGDWCNCTSRWDEAIVPFQWQNTTYRMLSWNPDEYMINMTPTVPLFVQAFFNYDSKKAFNDSFSYSAPSLWLAIWDGGLSLQDSLAYGYTRLQLIDALGTSSINLALRYREEPDKTSAYDYALTTMSTIPESKMTCDTSSDENYGPCHATIILQYPSFQRDVITIEAKMQWQDVAEAVGSWLSLFQIISWVFSGLGLAL